MSRLARSLHMMPPGSILDARLFSSTRDLNSLLDKARNQEVLDAKQIQKATGCSWSDAISQVQSNPDGEELNNSSHSIPRG